ncbi:hypothetical protein [Methylacidimicrobium cyclopophantes]|uniref:hypothetical protein n=1 Tax=Methylacidimicrobium cyclopophantes TaxID=1041766 RepID=UPI00115B18D7|nr:hypothetical protein [Methylacidimicrobium cyclopophantes]
MVPKRPVESEPASSRLFCFGVGFALSFVLFGFSPVRAAGRTAYGGGCCCAAPAEAVEWRGMERLPVERAVDSSGGCAERGFLGSSDGGGALCGGGGCGTARACGGGGAGGE